VATHGIPGAGCAHAQLLNAMAETVRIDPSAHATLTEIARAKHIPLTEALSRAVEAYRREVFLEAVASGFEALRNDPGAWAEEQAERAPWEATSADGLADE
jgi:hypothetical protein